MIFWRCYYHFVWTTKHRQSIITPTMETIIFDAIRAKSEELDCRVLAVNGTEDHIHVAVSIHPKTSISQWVKRVKGASSHAVNTSAPEDEERFRWQRGYGVLTFGKKNLPFVLNYILHQKKHHADQTTDPYLERMEEKEHPLD